MVETNEWVDAAHAQQFLDRRDEVPQLDVGYSELLAILPPDPKRVLDLGCGDGKVMAMIGGPGVAVDFSPHMLEAARARFHADDVDVIEHNLNAPLPDLGTFDLVVSAFAIHHCPHERKRALYAEVFDVLEPGGMFANLEHVVQRVELWMKSEKRPCPIRYGYSDIKRRPNLLITRKKQK